MARKKVEVVEEVVEVPVEGVEVHLDRDPNDPRLQETAKALPAYDEFEDEE